MNFLGHIYLTPDDDEVLFGNFIADSVKGTPEGKFSKRVAQGIRFHRAIDVFTDNHPIVKSGVERLRESQGRYASVVIDVVYDHILASSWADFHNQELEWFVNDVYDKLGEFEPHFPQRVSRFFPFMKEQNWLYNYQYEWGLLKSLEGLDRRSVIDTQMHKAVDVYVKHESTYRDEFQQFISDAKEMAERYSFD